MPAARPGSCGRSKTRRSTRARSSLESSAASRSTRCTRASLSTGSARRGCRCCCLSDAAQGPLKRLRRTAVGRCGLAIRAVLARRSETSSQTPRPRTTPMTSTNSNPARRLGSMSIRVRSGSGTARPPRGVRALRRARSPRRCARSGSTRRSRSARAARAVGTASRCAATASTRNLRLGQRRGRFGGLRQHRCDHRAREPPRLPRPRHDGPPRDRVEAVPLHLPADLGVEQSRRLHPRTAGKRQLRDAGGGAPIQRIGGPQQALDHRSEGVVEHGTREETLGVDARLRQPLAAAGTVDRRARPRRRRARCS